MVHSFSVTGLNGNRDLAMKFNPDVNIVTGKNGSGKTTVLKMLWYMISGNLERLVTEVTFKSVTLKADHIAITIAYLKIKGRRKMRITWRLAHERGTRTLSPDEGAMFLDRLNHKVVAISTESVFFPTFRRIESGFGVKEARYAERVSGPSPLPRLQEAMTALSDRLSVYDRVGKEYNHRFVASISTTDIVELLTRQYAEVSEQTNELHANLSAYITDTISRYELKAAHPSVKTIRSATSTLRRIQKRVRDVSEVRRAALRPFDVLSEVIEDVFKHRGITITESVVLGQSAEAIASDVLSAGEKQMLSFLCYNAFTQSAPIIIDEPELSLHVDWQRMLVPTLLDQQTGNQFILATHSPFIYAKYPDKEILLDDDRGF
jgi:predicted ATPase